MGIPYEDPDGTVRDEVDRGRGKLLAWFRDASGPAKAKGVTWEQVGGPRRERSGPLGRESSFYETYAKAQDDAHEDHKLTVQILRMLRRWEAKAQARDVELGEHSHLLRAWLDAAHAAIEPSMFRNAVQVLDAPLPGAHAEKKWPLGRRLDDTEAAKLLLLLGWRPTMGARVELISLGTIVERLAAQVKAARRKHGSPLPKKKPGRPKK